jgi:hypothetical protein
MQRERERMYRERGCRERGCIERGRERERER